LVLCSLIRFVLLSLLVCLLLGLDVFSLLLHFINHITVELLFIIKTVSALLYANQTLRLVASSSSCTTLRSYTNVLGNEVLRGEVLHLITLEVIDVLFRLRLLPLFNNLLQLIAD
jgi:hypothetical protein